LEWRPHLFLPLICTRREGVDRRARRAGLRREGALPRDLGSHAHRDGGARREKEEERAFYLHERLEKYFERSFTLPVDADLDRMTATFDTGVLKVHVPKIEAARPRKIEIAA
jgi:HSP20 family protein